MQPAFVALTDLSAAANSALAYLARLAGLVHGRVVLLHVYLNIDPLMEPEEVLITSPAELASRKQITADLQQQARQLPVPAEAELSLDTLATAIDRVVCRHHPLLLAMGRTRAPSLLARLAPSRARPVLQAARHPLLLVPESWTETQLPHRVMVAADGLPFWLAPSAQALQAVLAALEPAVSVVHIAPEAPGSARGAEALELVRRTELFGQLTKNNLYEVRDDDPVEGILQAASELQAQLVVVVARPHTFLGGLFHRSVTGQLLRHCPVPVLVLPTTE